MDFMRRMAGMGKAKAPSVVQKDKDESIVFFRELYKREKDRDVNLLEPMYSVEFDTIRGGQMSKLPSGKRDFLIPVDEKHDYDWLKTPTAAPLFPSLEMEANSSKMVFQKELPIPRPVKSSASRLSGKLEAAKTSARSSPPTADLSSKKNFIRGAPAISREKNQPYTMHKRSTYTALTNRQQEAVAATTAATTGAVKKHSDRCYASQGSSTTAVKSGTNPEAPYKAPKNLLTSGSKFARSKDPALGVHTKGESGRTRGQSCPPAATIGIKKLQLDGKQNVLPAKGNTVTGSEPACKNSSHTGEATLMKGVRRDDGKRKQRLKFASQANN